MIILNNIDALKCKGYLLNKINEMSQSIILVNNKMKIRELHINNLEKMNADKQEQISKCGEDMQDMNKKKYLNKFKHQVKLTGVKIVDRINQTINRILR